MKNSGEISRVLFNAPTTSKTLTMKIKKHFTFGILITFSIFCSCVNGNLTRSEAKDILLKNVYYGKYIKITFPGIVTACQGRNFLSFDTIIPGKDKEGVIIEILQKKGYITHNKSLEIEPTDKVIPFLEAGRHFSITTDSIIDLTIIGITDEGSYSTVDYDITFTMNSLGKEIYNYLNTSDKAQYFPSRDNTIHFNEKFKLYDDGWRIKTGW
jgi:lipopolysaccharide export LptBFGC system permease protein LptF